MGRHDRRGSTELASQRIGSVGNPSRDTGVDLSDLRTGVQAVAAPAVWPYRHRTLAEVFKDETMKFPRAFDYRGGAVDLAQAAGVTVHAVYAWRSKNEIPARHVPKVKLAVADRTHSVTVVKQVSEAPAIEKAVKLSDIAELVLRYLKAREL